MTSYHFCGRSTCWSRTWAHVPSKRARQLLDHSGKTTTEPSLSSNVVVQITESQLKPQMDQINQQVFFFSLKELTRQSRKKTLQKVRTYNNSYRLKRTQSNSTYKYTKHPTIPSSSHTTQCNRNADTSHPQIFLPLESRELAKFSLSYLPFLSLYFLHCFFSVSSWVLICQVSSSFAEFRPWTSSLQ
jgi:hypothetical protein